MSQLLAVHVASRNARLWAEFVALFVGAPILMAAFFGSYSLFAVLWLLAGLSACLLAVTPGFRWRSLVEGSPWRDWPLILGFAALTALSCSAIVTLVAPEAFLAMPRHMTGLWLMILVFYPPLSALPQELIYRSLFFERYGRLFPTKGAAIAANGLLFGFGHLFYMHPITIGATAVTGAILGWAYLRRRSVILTWILHAVAGQLVFTIGLGRFFYHGAVG